MKRASGEFQTVATIHRNPRLFIITSVFELLTCGSPMAYFGKGQSAPPTSGSFRALSPDDTLVVWRLGGISGLIQVGAEFRARGSKRKSLTEQFETGSPEGEGLWKLGGVLAAVDETSLRTASEGGYSETITVDVPEYDCGASSSRKKVLNTSTGPCPGMAPLLVEPAKVKVSLP